jgi:hypothetical protein
VVSPYPTRAEWSGFVGDRFEGPSAGVELVLSTITDTSEHSYSLIFLGPPHPVLDQGVVRLEHAARPAIDIFIVPVGADESEVRYEAIFNFVPDSTP